MQQQQIRSSYYPYLQSVSETLHTRNDLATSSSTLIRPIELEDHRASDDEDERTGDHHGVDAWMVGRLCKEFLVSDG